MLVAGLPGRARLLEVEPGAQLVQRTQDQRVAAQQAHHEQGQQRDGDSFGDDDSEHAITLSAGRWPSARRSG